MARGGLPPAVRPRRARPRTSPNHRPVDRRAHRGQHHVAATPSTATGPQCQDPNKASARSRPTRSPAAPPPSTSSASPTIAARAARSTSRSASPIPPDGLLGAVGLGPRLRNLRLHSRTTSTQFDFDRRLSWNTATPSPSRLPSPPRSPPRRCRPPPTGTPPSCSPGPPPPPAPPGGYKVEVSEDAGITWADAEDDTGSTDTSWIHEGLPAAASHYRVSALVSGEASDPSATASATTRRRRPWCSPRGIFGGPTSPASAHPRLGPASFRHGGSTFSDQFVHTDLLVVPLSSSASTPDRSPASPCAPARGARPRLRHLQRNQLQLHVVHPSIRPLEHGQVVAVSPRPSPPQQCAGDHDDLAAFRCQRTRRR